MAGKTNRVALLLRHYQSDVVQLNRLTNGTSRRGPTAKTREMAGCLGKPRVVAHCPFEGDFAFSEK